MLYMWIFGTNMNDRSGPNFVNMFVDLFKKAYPVPSKGIEWNFEYHQNPTDIS